MSDAFQLPRADLLGFFLRTLSHEPAKLCAVGGQWDGSAVDADDIVDAEGGKL